jgi:hypothetical protein
MSEEDQLAMALALSAADDEIEDDSGSPQNRNFIIFSV